MNNLYELKDDLSRRVIGGIILVQDPEVATPYILELKDNYFEPEYRFIISAIFQLWQEKKSLEVQNIYDELIKEPECRISLTDLSKMLDVGIKTDLKNQIDKLRDLTRLIHLRKDVLSVISENIEQKLSLPDSFEELDRILYNSQIEHENLFQIYSFDQFEKDCADITTHRIPSALLEVDEDETPVYYYKGAISILAARTGDGKTTFMMNESIRLMENYKVCFISLEEKTRDLLKKLIVVYHNVHHTNKIGLEDLISHFDNYKHYANDILQNLYLIKPERDIDSIRRVILYMHKRYGIDLFFIDYIQLISSVDLNRKNTFRHEEIKQINSVLLQTCDEYNLALILGSQIRRQSAKFEDDEILTDTTVFSESGSIEQDANLAVTFRSNQGKMMYGIPKNRNHKRHANLSQIPFMVYQPQYWLIEKAPPHGRFLTIEAEKTPEPRKKARSTSSLQKLDF